jgi:ubiquinone/menaquinone biosynthesis C-methylase UbiE
MLFLKRTGQSKQRCFTGRIQSGSVDGHELSERFERGVLRDQLHSSGEFRMADSVTRFDDGAAYERMMGTWSRLAGEVFVDWVKPKPHLDWLDVGCGNGAFTELLIDRCAASKVHGIDPSVAQIDFARLRRQSHDVTFQCADAESLPFPNDSFDAAVMALVIFFLPSPAKGVQEMVRVVRSGGLVAAYAWDAVGLGMPHAPIGKELLAMGFQPGLPPSANASRLDVLHQLWEDAGLRQIETKFIDVQRTFEDFEDYWTTNLLAATIGSVVAKMSSDQLLELKARVRLRLAPGPSGSITYETRANAVKGFRS